MTKDNLKENFTTPSASTWFNILAINLTCFSCAFIHTKFLSYSLGNVHFVEIKKESIHIFFLSLYIVVTLASTQSLEQGLSTVLPVSILSPNCTMRTNVPISGLNAWNGYLLRWDEARRLNFVEGGRPSFQALQTWASIKGKRERK